MKLEELTPQQVNDRLYDLAFAQVAVLKQEKKLKMQEALKEIRRINDAKM